MECLGLELGEKTKLAKKFGDFHKKMQEYAKLMRNNPMHEVLEELIQEIDYPGYLDKKYHLHYEDKIANVHELVIALEDFKAKHPRQGLSDWLQSVTLNNADGEEAPGVSLMTLHSAKGLEFQRVYISGTEDGLVPHANNVEDKELLEEERRLFYVGITRAMQKLSLYGVVKRRGYQGWVANPPSRFLDEIPEKHVKCDPAATEAMRIQKREFSYDDIDGNMNEGVDSYDYDDGQASEAMVLRVGAKVYHPTYGRGAIKEIMSEGVRSQVGLKVKVSFDDFGIRKIYAHHLE
jgi:ATP-dependent exoDNAse (exonuclease V) beta subunit